MRRNFAEFGSKCGTVEEATFGCVGSGGSSLGMIGIMLCSTIV